MRICTVQFGGYKKDNYKKLLNAFRRSCAKNMSNVVFDEIIIPDQERDYHLSWVQQSNTIKLKIWYEYMLNTKDTVIFADCDMIATGDASVIDKADFDIAYAGSDKTKTPMNGGIIIARPTAAARNFFRSWVKHNDVILNQPSEFKKYSKWAGQNQRAFGRMLDVDKPDCKMLQLDPVVWNATDSYWDKINNETIFIHIKGQLRKLLLDEKQPCSIYKKAMIKWYQYSDADLKKMEAKWKQERHFPRIPNRWA